IVHVCSAKRLVDRRALLSEKLWTIFGNVQTIFQANSKLTIDCNRRFIAEAHAWLNRRLVPAHEVCPLVTVETDAVTGAMRQAGNIVVGTKARIGDHFARGGVD